MEKKKRRRHFHILRRLRGIFKLDVIYIIMKKKSTISIGERIEKKTPKKQTLDRKCGHDFAKLRNLGSSGR